MTTTTMVTARRAMKSMMMADDDMATGYDDVDGDGETVQWATAQRATNSSSSRGGGV